MIFRSLWRERLSFKKRLNLRERRKQAKQQQEQQSDFQTIYRSGNHYKPPPKDEKE
jgi:hypothetical protein